MPKSDKKSAEFLETPEKENSQMYSQTPVSSQRKKSLLKSNQDKQTSENVKDYFNASTDLRYKIYQKDALDKIRVSLFHDKDQNIEFNGQIIPVQSTSFYGSSNQYCRFLPLAPDMLGTTNKKIDKNKSSPSLYDFPQKKITRKRRGGKINSGVSHGIKKPKCKANSIKTESSEVDENSVVENKRRSSQKENVEEVEDSQKSIEEYNPNRKFFKHKRPVVLEIALGNKPKPKKNVKKKETVVNFSNVFHSLNSKKQFHQKLKFGRHSNLNSEAIKNTLPNVGEKKEIYSQSRQSSLDARKLFIKTTSNSKEYSNTQPEIKNEADESINNGLPIHLDEAMDIENNNFSNNETSQFANHNTEVLSNELMVGKNLCFMGNSASNVRIGQNNLEKENSDDGQELNCCNGLKNLQIDVEHSIDRDLLVSDRNIQCQICKFVYEFANTNEEFAHFDYHSDFCTLQFKGWNVEHSVEFNIDSGSRIVVIKPFDPISHKKKVLEVLRVIKKEIGLCENDLIDNHMTYSFLYIQGTSIVGVVVAEYIDSAFRLKFNSSAPYRMPSETPARCGINAIWVLKSHRRQGIATKMMDFLRNYFIKNCTMHLDDIAFSIPTPIGQHFAEKYVCGYDLKIF